MSRATTIVPVSARRVFTGYCDSWRRISAIGRLRSTGTPSLAEMLLGRLGQVLRRIGLELLQEHAVGRDLGEDLAVRPARHADADRQAGTVARQADHPDVVAEILAAELRADAEHCGQLVDLPFHLEVAEGVARLAAWVGSVSSQRVEASLTVLSVSFGRGAADDDGEVVRRAGRGAERLDLRLQEPQQPFRRKDRAASPGTGSSCWPSRRPWRRTSGGIRRRGRSPGAATMSNCTGRLLPVLTSSNIDSGAICE